LGHRYQQMDISTATPEALVSKLFQAAIRNSKRAIELEGDAHVGGRGHAISKTVAIVGELRSSLDHERGGEIADNLGRLYDFVIDRLTEGHLKKESQPIAEALMILSTLEEAWSQIARQSEKGAA